MKYSTLLHCSFLCIAMFLSLCAGAQTAANASYAIDFTETSIVFSKDYDSFQNVPTKDFSYEKQTFISQNNEEWTFTISNKNTGVKRVNKYLQIGKGTTLNSPDMSSFANGYKVAVNYYRSSTGSIYLCYLNNDNKEVRAEETKNGTTYNKQDGYTAEIEVPYGVKFYIWNTSTITTIESITITPNPTTKKQATKLSFPEASYTVQEGKEFAGPTATLTTTDGEAISGAIIAYAISTNDYLTIDQQTGQLSGEFKAGQTVTVTATFAGNDQYEGATASYELKVVSAEETVLTLDETQDIDELINQYNGTMVEVVLKRKLTGRYNTICLPFDLNSEQLREAFGEDCVLSEYSYVENGVMYFTAVSDLKAGTPYLLSISGTKEETTIPDVLISNTQPVQVSRSDNAAFMYCGAYSPFAFTATDGSQLFLTTNGVLKKPSTAGSKMKGMRAYFIVPTTMDVSTMSINVDSGHSAIRELHSDSPRTVQGVYSLSGQRLADDPSSLRPGIYIVDGKKQLVR